MSEFEPKIVLISPVRNEEHYLEKTIESVANQKLTPKEWLIVDDGSTDKTPEILQKAAEKYSWIHVITKPDRGKRSVGPGVVEAFYYGYERLKQCWIKCLVMKILNFVDLSTHGKWQDWD